MLSRTQFYSECFRRTLRGKFLLAEVFSSLGVLVCFALTLIWQPLAGDMSIVLLAVFGTILIGTLAVGMLNAPFGIYREMFDDYDIERKLTPEEERLQDGRARLAIYIVHGRHILENKKFLGPSKKYRNNWRTAVIDTLKEYYPEFCGEFETTHSKYKQMAARDKLIDDLGKLESIQRSVQNRIDRPPC